MGELQPGDLVFDENGHPTTVVSVSPILVAQRAFLVRFSDGSTIEADGEHLWKTISYCERQGRSRTTEAFRSARRARRPRRGEGKRPDVVLSNSVRSYAYKPRPTGSVRTTDQIWETLFSRGRINHAVQTCGPLDLPFAALPLDPYTLGAWLGDGHGNTGMVTGIDSGVFDEIRRAGFEVYQPPSAKNEWRVRGLTSILRSMELLSGKKSAHKAIPPEYLRASLGQRLALLQGLMDTDGFCAADSGKCEFTTTKPRLRDDVFELLTSLGCKVSLCEGDAKLNGRVIGRKWRLYFYSSLPAFRLQRKLRRQKRSGFRGEMVFQRYIVGVEPISPRPMRCIAVASDTHMYLAGRAMIPTHNTIWLRWDPLITQWHIEHQRWLDAKERGEEFSSVGWALHVRREYPMLLQTILYVRAVSEKLDPGVKWDGDNYILNFLCGYKYQFGHVQHEEDWRRYDSNDYTALYVDEAIQILKVQYDMLRSRVRTTDPILAPLRRICLATNPDAPAEGVWVKERFVDPAPEGRKMLTEWIEHEDGTREPWTRIYIPATLDDNPDEAFKRQYRTALSTLPTHIRNARLYAKWDSVQGAFFEFEWIPEVHVVEPYEIPMHWTVFRVMDWGYKSPCPILYVAVDEEENLIVFDELNFNHKVREDQRKDDELVAIAIKKHEKEQDSRAEIRARVSGTMRWRKLWNKAGDYSNTTGPADNQIREQRGTRGPTIEQAMANYGIYWAKCTKDRHAATTELVRRLKDIPKKGASRPGITVFKTCKETCRTIPLIPVDPNDPEVPRKGPDDHWLDCLFYACMYRVGAAEKQVHRGHEFDEEDELAAARKRLAESSDRKWGYGT